VGFSGVVANHHIGWFKIPVDIPHRMETLQSVQKLEGDDDCGLLFEPILLERFLEFFEVDSQQLHHQVVVVLVRTVRVESGKANPPVSIDSGLAIGSFDHVGLIGHEFGIDLDCLGILVVDAVVSEWLPLGQLHHVLH